MKGGFGGGSIFMMEKSHEECVDSGEIDGKRYQLKTDEVELKKELA